MSDLPLEGTTVVSIEQAVAAPYATRQLADLGARVIKIERPGEGDFARYYDETVLGESSYFVWINRSKESLTLDIKTEAGKRVLYDLLGRADVFVQNLGPGAASRLGLDAASLSAPFPRLIVCDVSGYGSSGPWSDRKAYDLLVQCETGLVSLTGPPDAPSRAGISIADIAAGMYAYSGILTALLRRATTGKVSSVQVSLFEALAEWMGGPAYYTRYSGTQPQRVGVAHPTVAPYGPYETADGATVLVAVQNQREWASFCDVVLGNTATVEDQRFATNSARVTNRTALDALIAARFRSLDADEALALLGEAGVANARMNTMHDFLDHPSLRGRDRWREVSSPGGTIEALLPPADLSGVEARMGPVPVLGQHTEEILEWLGLDTEAVQRLRLERVI